MDVTLTIKNLHHPLYKIFDGVLAGSSDFAQAPVRHYSPTIKNSFFASLLHEHLDFGIWALTSKIYLPPDLSFPLDDKLGGGQFLQAHRAKGMKFRGANPYLSTQTQFEPVVKSGRGID